MLNDDESTPKDKGYGWGPKCGNYWINQIFERALHISEWQLQTSTHLHRSLFYTFLEKNQGWQEEKHSVMGPSGAGKTAFLSALAVKAHGCKITGSILINGKPDSIHSYKKIIGFVAQDDIVHGNLNVEENLWFSAKCRLPARMLKQDHVLVVERVIESLGLQAVRSSLVGSVEKHGISGGQRKRVNVGLEMVMEPSLLILDEPTFGLDSSSSQLLLRALRRETLEGVNVSMVVHQPSYSLFQMFDDLVLLAKGGLTVYYGPVRKVEEYFSGLGINVPDRVNPPDFFLQRIIPFCFPLCIV